jgi:hypothetical protein
MTTLLLPVRQLVESRGSGNKECLAAHLTLWTLPGTRLLVLLGRLVSKPSPNQNTAARASAPVLHNISSNL